MDIIFDKDYERQFIFDKFLKKTINQINEQVFKLYSLKIHELFFSEHEKNYKYLELTEKLRVLIFVVLFQLVQIVKIQCWLKGKFDEIKILEDHKNNVVSYVIKEGQQYGILIGLSGNRMALNCLQINQNDNFFVFGRDNFLSF